MLTASRASPAPPLPVRPELEPLAIDVEADAHGRAIAVVTGIGIDARAYPIDLRRWAAQLNAAADVLEAHAGTVRG